MTNNTQSNIFDNLFGLVDHHAEKQAAEQAAKMEKEKAEREEKLRKLQEQTGTSSSASDKDVAVEKKEQAKKPTVPTFKVNEDTVIRWWHMVDGKPVNELPISKYFSAEEIVEGVIVKKKDSEDERKMIDGEMLRKRMEKDFPELVKSFTEMICLDKSNTIHPTIQSKKKGAQVTGVEYQKYNDFLLSERLPFSILRSFIAAAKLYGQVNLEVHADIYYDFNKHSFFLDFPYQQVHTYWVEVLENSHSIRERVGDVVKVMEIHSHHTMKPIPSNQDDESERFPGMFYAIVGETDKFFPEISVRRFISEEQGFLILEPSSIFEEPFFELPKYDSDKIEVRR